MFTNDRLKKILQILEAEESVRIADLSKQLDVSEATIRRDLDALHAQEKITRVHGGAVLNERPVFEPPVHKRIHQFEKEKKAIARSAAALVKNGESVFLGSGTTTMEIAKLLTDRENLTVVTNSLLIAQVLATVRNINLIFLGGFLRTGELSFIGHITELAISEVRVDKIIIGVPAIDVKTGLTNDYLPEVNTDRAILKMGAELIIVADHTKFQKTASAYLAPLSHISVLVTDEQTDKNYLAQIQAKGVKVIVAE